MSKAILLRSPCHALELGNSCIAELGSSEVTWRIETNRIQAFQDIVVLSAYLEAPIAVEAFLTQVSGSLSLRKHRPIYTQ